MLQSEINMATSAIQQKNDTLDTLGTNIYHIMESSGRGYATWLLTNNLPESQANWDNYIVNVYIP